MRTNYRLLWAVLGLGAMLFTGACANLTPSQQVLPSAVGSNATIDDMVANASTYVIWYSGPVYNPSALLFLPPERPSSVHLGTGWTEVKGKAQLTDMIHRMRDVRDVRLKLWALKAPENINSSTQQPLGFVYTAGHVTLVKGKSPGTSIILSVPERFNPKYYDEDAMFPRTERLSP